MSLRDCQAVAMDIEVMHTSGCPNVADLIDHLARRDLTVTVTVVASEEPVPGKFSGSPTVLVDGENPFGGEQTSAPACALYPPTIEQIDEHLVGRLRPDATGS